MKLPARIALALLCLAALLGASCSREAKDARHRERADEFFAEAKYDRAELEYLNVLRDKPGDAHAIARLGRIYFAQGQLGRAFPLLSHVRQSTPDDLDNRVVLSQLSLAAGRRQEAIDEASYVLSKRPTDARAVLTLGEAAADPTQIESVRAQLTALPPEVARSAPVLTALGFLTARGGDAAGAERHFNEALAADAKLPEVHTGFALLALARGDVKAADAALAKAAELSGPRDRARIQYAAFKFQTGDAATGRRLLEEITREAPDYLPAILRQVDVAGNEGRLDEAEALLASARGRDPNNPEVLVAGGKLALARRDAPKAIAELSKLIELYPGLAPAHFELARAHVAAFDIEKAVDHLNRALQLAPDFADASVLLATLDLRRGNRSSAIVTLRQLVAKRPGLVEAQLLLAEAYRAQGEAALALPIYEALRTAAPTNDRIALLHGNALIEQRRFADARATFTEVLGRSPGNPAAIEQLTAIDLAENTPTAARARLDSVLAAFPSAAALRVISAQFHFAVKEPDRAVAELRKAIELDPGQMAAYGLLARHYLQSGSLAEALESLGRVVERNPRDVAAWMLAASIHEQRADWPRAREAYERLLAVSPRFGLALNNLAVVLSERFGEKDKALELAKAAREVLPTEPNVADTLGWILYQRGEFAPALTLLRESADRLPESADVRYHLGMTQYALGDAGPATNALEAALAKSPQAEWAAEANERLAVLRLAPPADAAARALLDTALKQRPNDIIALDRLARLQESDGKLDLALATREKLQSLAPQNGPAMLALAQLHARRGETAPALARARDARRLAPQDPAVARTLGKLALEAGDYGWALGLLDEAARRQPNDADLQSELGLAAFANGKIDEAQAAWKRSLAAAPSSPAAAARREDLDLLEAWSSPAPRPTLVARARTRAGERPNDLLANAVTARAAEREGQPAEARQHWETVLRLSPSFAPARRALILHLASEPSNDNHVLELARDLREMALNDREVARSLGRVSGRTSDNRRTLGYLEAAIRLGADDAGVWFELGTAQQALGQAAPARTSMQKALDRGLSGDAATRAREIAKPE